MEGLKELVLKARPLFTLDAKELVRFGENAIMMAETVDAGPDHDSMASQIIRVTTFRMLCDLNEEISNRN